MTKKIFAMFLAVLMVVSMLPTSVFAAGCPAEHNKSNCEYTEVMVTAPDCGNKGYTTYKCNACGETFVADFVDPVGEHIWKDADPVAETCEKNGSVGGKECTVCGTVVDATPVDKIPNGLKCEFGAWLPANVDCTTGGTQTRTCAHCGHVEERKVDKVAGGHVLSGWELKTPATAEATGLAVKKCTNTNCPYTVEQVVFFDHDHDAQTLLAVAEVAAKCEQTGVKAHYECRVCGLKFVYGKATPTAAIDTYNLVTDADLVIKTKHDQILDGLTCMTTTYVCQETITVGGVAKVCGTILKVDAAASHDYNDWTTVVAATCTTDGYQRRTCKVANCGNVDTKIVPALGHIEASTSVEATCVQYAYTFTYCLRPGCANLQKSTSVKIGDKNVSFDLTKGEAILEAPVVGIPFYFKALRNDVIWYIKGGNNAENRIDATKEITEAAQFYLELANVDSEVPAYNLYYFNNGTKTYISVAPDASNSSVITFVYTLTAPKDYFVWNEEYGVLTTYNSSNGRTYFFGMNKSGENFAGINATNLSQIGTSRFAPVMFTSNANGVALLNITPNVTAGFNVNGHAWEKFDRQAPTCQLEGYLVEICGNGCGINSKTTTLAKVEHSFKDDATNTTGNVAVDCVTDGKTNQICEFGCGTTNVKVTPATGHTLKQENYQVKSYTHAGSHTDRIAYDYNLCTNANCPAEGKRVNKTNVRAWEGTNKLYNSLEEAKAAHTVDGVCGIADDATGVIVDAGDCTTVGYMGYPCSCGVQVRVKIAGTGAHLFPTAGIVIGEVTYTKGYQAATCTAAGYSINFECARCEKLVDETLAENKLTVIPALGHTWTTFTAKQREDLDLGDYVKAPCGTPVYDNYVAYCSVCHPNGVTNLAAAVAAGTVKADTKLIEKSEATGALCTKTVYELYQCHCGETHMRGYLATGKNINHAWILDTTKGSNNDGIDESTHTVAGTMYVVCKYCDATNTAPVAVLPHKNAAGQEFTNACNDPITDRHCVLCCTAECKADKKHDCVTNKDAQGKADPCDCVIANVHAWGQTNYVDAVCGDAPYVSRICSICYKTSAVDATEYWTGRTDAQGNKVMAPITGLGHKPVAADAEKYGAYTYVEIVHPEYVWEDGVVVMTNASKVAYEAKFIEYKAPTFTADGYAKFVCADCGQTVEEVLPAEAGLGFVLEIENANGQEGITMGSLVNVTLYADGSDALVNTFALTAEFEDMLFVGSQAATSDFNLHVTNTLNANVGSEIHILANAVNTADKKQQNITIGEKTPILVMQFIVVGYGIDPIAADNANKLTVEMEGTAYDMKGAVVPCKSAEAEFEVKTLMDYNEDGNASIVDLIQAETILTGESEKTYDVSVDVDKDGEVTLYDLTLIYEFMVNAGMSSEEAYVDFVLTGLSEEHVAVVHEYIGFMTGSTECNSSTCDAEIAPGQNYCPVCGNRQ